MTLPKKLTKDKIVKLITDCMLGNRGCNSDGFEHFGLEIIVVEQDGQRFGYLADENKVLKPLSVEGMAAEILLYIDRHTNSNLLVDHDLAIKIAKTYLLRAIPIDLPPVVREYDDPGYCMHRHPYNLLEAVTEGAMRDACPLFADWVDRVEVNREALIHWIGSVFVPGSYNQQYLILQGSGMDGKGSLLQCFAEFFGPTFAATYSDRVGSKEWTSETFGKQLVVFSDAQNLQFANKEVFKAITGGDPVSYRFLYKKAFTGVSEAKFIICTNEDVDVTMMESDKRRRIFARITSGKPIKDYVRSLMEEAPVFFSWCRSEYLKNCEPFAPIPVDKSVEEDLEENSVDMFDEFFDSFLIDKGSCRRSYAYQLFSTQCSRNKDDWRRFKIYLEKHHAVTEKRIDGKWRLVGVSTRFDQRHLQKR